MKRGIMITITRINGSNLVLNALLIETIESTPDTVITLTNGKRYICKENTNEIIEKVKNYIRETHQINVKY